MRDLDLDLEFPPEFDVGVRRTRSSRRFHLLDDGEPVCTSVSTVDEQLAIAAARVEGFSACRSCFHPDRLLTLCPLCSSVVVGVLPDHLPECPARERVAPPPAADGGPNR